MTVSAGDGGILDDHASNKIAIPRFGVKLPVSLVVIVADVGILGDECGPFRVQRGHGGSVIVLVHGVYERVWFSERRLVFRSDLSL